MLRVARSMAGSSFGDASVRDLQQLKEPMVELYAIVGAGLISG